MGEMRLIDASALKEKAFSDPDTTMSGEAMVYVQDIDDAPTIDAVPVVRCKDCKNCNWVEETNYIHYPFCIANFRETREDDYCSYGERKDGGTHG